MRGGRRSLTRAGLVVGGLGAALLLGAVVALLALVLSSVNGLEETLQRTNAHLRGTEQRVGAVERHVDPLTPSVPEELRRIRPGVRATRQDVDTIASELLPSVDRASRLLAGAVVPLGDDLQAADLPRLAAVLDRLAREGLALLQDRPVAEVVTGLDGLLRRARRLDLLGDADRAVADLRATRTLIADLRRSLNASVRVQCATLERITSIDRKTGGELPPDAAPELNEGDCPR